MMSTEGEVASAPSEVASPKEEEEENHKVRFIVEEEEKQNVDDSSTFLEAVMTQPAEAEEKPDIENQQQQQQRPALLPATNHSIGILASHKSHRINKTTTNDNNDNGKENEQNDDGSSTDSVFSFDSYELKGIPLNFQSVIHPQISTTVAGASTTAPFPSIVAASIEHSSNNALPISHNTCPCHCLFFTVKESICLVMSALGCAVFFAGLVVLCLYLEGTLFAERETA